MESVDVATVLRPMQQTLQLFLYSLCQYDVLATSNNRPLLSYRYSSLSLYIFKWETRSSSRTHSSFHCCWYQQNDSILGKSNLFEVELSTTREASQNSRGFKWSKQAYLGNVEGQICGSVHWTAKLQHTAFWTSNFYLTTSRFTTFVVC